MLSANQILNGGRYRVISVSGQDESGGLYDAYDTVSERNVTLRERVGRGSKVITGGQLAALNAEFAMGAKALSGVRHESLVGVQDYFSDIDRQYLVLDALPGEDLATLAARERPPLTHVIAWAEQLLNALDNLHRQTPPIIHHEIRPSNIRITSNHRAKLLIGGVPVSQASDTVTLIPGQSVSNPTFNYKPLEQLWGGLDPASQRVILNTYDERSAGVLLRPFDARTDLYSLAATLYHVLTGSIPTDALERSIALLEGKADPLAPVSDLSTDTPREVSDVLARAFSIRREQRFDSALEMLRDLRSASMRLDHVAEPAVSVALPSEQHGLAEIEAEEAQLAEETKRLEARRAELEAERTRREQEAAAELQHREEQRLAAEAELEHRRAAERIAALEAERERTLAEEERLDREAEAERKRGEERLREIEAERTLRHDEQLRLEAEAKLELEISRKKFAAISGYGPGLEVGINGEESALPFSIEADNSNSVLSADEAPPKSRRGIAVAAVAGVAIVAGAVGVWQLMSAASTPPRDEPLTVNSGVIPPVVPEASPAVEQIAQVPTIDAPETTAVAEANTQAVRQPRPQVSAVSERQKRPVAVAAAKPPTTKKKITVDDLINDN